MQTCYSNVIRRHLPTLHDAHHGHGALAGGHVPAESIADFANQRHETAAFPVDHVRGRASRVHGVRYRV